MYNNYFYLLYFNLICNYFLLKLLLNPFFLLLNTNIKKLLFSFFMKKKNMNFILYKRRIYCRQKFLYSKNLNKLRLEYYCKNLFKLI